MMHKVKKNVVKNAVRYMIYVISVATACYGFWGCLFPDLTLVEGTYRIVAEAEQQAGHSEQAGTVYGKSKDAEQTNDGAEDMEQQYRKDKEALYADMLSGKVQVTFRSKVIELLKQAWTLK